MFLGYFEMFLVRMASLFINNGEHMSQKFDMWYIDKRKVMATETLLCVTNQHLALSFYYLFTLMLNHPNEHTL